MAAKTKKSGKVKVKSAAKVKSSSKSKSKAKLKAKTSSKVKAKAKNIKNKTGKKANSKVLKVKADKKTISKKVKAKVSKKAVSKSSQKKQKTIKSKATLAVQLKPSKVAVKTSTKAQPLSEVITPLDDRIIVEVQAGEKMTSGGLIIPDTAQMTGNKKGTILATGRGHKDQKGRLRPLDVKVGDVVVFGEFSGSKLELMGQSFLILRETDLLGVVE